MEVTLAGQPTLHITADGANPSVWNVVDGHAVASDAYPQTDVVLTTGPERVELFLTLRAPGTPSSFSWQLGLAEGFRVKATPGENGFVIARPDGTDVLRIPPASAVDAAGTVRSAKLGWDGARLRLDVDTTGLRFPVLIDPAVESFLWQLSAPAAKPSGRQLAAAAYDVQHAQVVLFGGIDSGGTHLGDTWTWNGTTWSPTCPEAPAACANGIPGRTDHAMAYDSARKVTVLYGGSDGSPTRLADVWEWNGASWTSRGAGPPKRADAALVYDSARARMVLFGGFGGSGVLGDIWEYDGASWTERCVTGADACTGEAMPSARYLHHMAFDGALGVTMLFGGYDPTATPPDLGDTWTWNGTHWSKQCDACAAGRSSAAIAYDSARGRVVVYGGYDSTLSKMLADTLEWNGTSWSTTVASAGPISRRSAAAYDAARGRVVLFGGDGTEGGAPNATMDTTWLYHSRGSGCSAGTECDTGFCVNGVCCETACNGACQRCDQSPTPGVCSTFVNGTDAECAGYCDGSGACQTKFAAGTACAAAYECQAGTCSSVDRVCCNTDCAGLCQSCIAAKTGAGAGVCSPVKVATDPDTECPDDGAAGCDRNGSCDGAGACQLYAANTQCVAQSCAGTTLSAPDLCNGSGACVDKGTSSCATGYKCNAGGTACNVTCSADGDCAAGYFCLGSVCTLKRAQSQACTLGSQCANGNCADGFCCNVACGAACDVCAATLGASANGTCGTATKGVSTTQCATPLACNGVSTTCAASGACVNDADCGGGFYCKGDGKCSPQVNQGGTCDATVGANGCKTGGCRVCGSAGGCVGGVCCDTACGGACDVCTVATVGVCTVVAKGAGACGGYECNGASANCPATCAAIADCASGYYCDAANHCTAKKAQGQACGGPDQCSNGRCVDGFCCDTPCTNKCDACSAALKDSAKDDGVCGAARTGSDPHDDCAATAPSSCGTTGNCDGAGACALHANTACGATSCVSGVAFVGQACDGFGNCKNQQTQQDCTPYVCSTTTSACANPCQTDQDCQNPTQNRCSNGTCVPKRAPGGGCATGDECLSANCVDGVCCDDACQGQCQFCADSANLGHCTTLTAGPPKMAGTTARSACAGTGVCQGECKGVATACTFPSAGTACATPSCTGNSLTPAATCDNAGLCSTPTAQDCGDYACDGTAGACKTSCVTSADCTAGGVCITSDHRCTTAGTTCDGDFALKSTDGTVSSCNGYRCIVNACQQQCSTSLDCAPGYGCTAARCVASPDAGRSAGAGGTHVGAGGGTSIQVDGSTSGSGGSFATNVDGGSTKPPPAADKGACGCRTASQSGSSAPLSLAGLGVLFAVARRRRTASIRMVRWPLSK